MSAQPDQLAVEDQIAVVGMAGRFPGATDVDALWRLSAAGGTGFVTGDADPAEPGRVPVYGVLPQVDRFDADYFGVSEREAELLDPQQRILLEVAQHGLDDAGIDVTGRIVSVYASATPYAGPNPHLGAAARHEWDIAHHVDYTAARIAYRLDLHGEALTVQAACASSLAAVHLAAQSLLAGQCDVAVVAGVSVLSDQTGYRAEDGLISSPSGVCRPFDIEADGTVPGSGAGVVVLKRLVDAERDGDRVRAVIRGTAANNDGSAKIGFTAPSPNGQAEVISVAHAVAGVAAGSIAYVETHGTATQIGDQIEVEGLRMAFDLDEERVHPTALGSLKANCGHLEHAAGIAALIRTVLAVEHGVIPPMASCTKPSPHLDLGAAGFYLPLVATPWPAHGGPRRAGVSAFGVGGTNVHVVVQQAPAAAPRPVPASGPVLWPLSGHSPQALQALTDGLHTDTVDAADVAAALARRRVGGCRSYRVVDSSRPDRAVASAPVHAAQAPRTAFAFPGLAGPHVDGMHDLYLHEPAFARAVDRCAEVMRSATGEDLLDALYAADQTAIGERLRHSRLFAVEWALVQLWHSWGVQADVVIGQAGGELAAAAVAGALAHAQAVRLAAARDGCYSPASGSGTDGTPDTGGTARVVSGMTGTWAGAELSTAQYWGRPPDPPTRFREGLDTVASVPDVVVVVIGPGQEFAATVERALVGRVVGVAHAYPSAGDQATRTRGDWLAAAGTAWSLGAAVDLSALCPTTGRHVSLPPTHFDHSRRWNA